MYTQDDLLPLSALQHLVFCERQCALIHIEQMWDENRFTAEGRIMHEHVHDAGRESRGRVRIERGVLLRSLRLGLIGKADVVEFHLIPSQTLSTPDGGSRHRAGKTTWLPFPVEHKRGKPKPDDSDRVQLCAQALCLEEMLGMEVPSGAIFYGRTRRRLDVDFDGHLRDQTEKAAGRLHQMIELGATPPPVYSKQCDSCSLNVWCLPRVSAKTRRVRDYLLQALEEE